MGRRTRREGDMEEYRRLKKVVKIKVWEKESE